MQAISILQKHSSALIQSAHREESRTINQVYVWQRIVVLTKDGAAQPITAESTVMAARAPRAPANTCGRQLLKPVCRTLVQPCAGSLLKFAWNSEAVH